ncbi:MAG: DUF4139 domain-containing protein [Candidatus Eisenbacteria bacterium]|nr:DUF4139 domain-containing protein [Candidatus Eisenbacteria bacterium]
MRSLLLVAAALLLGLSGLQAAEPGVSITIYNSDMALVKDVRAMELRSGVHEVQFPDVAQRIDPTSVHFKILEGPDASVWEQNYRFDLASSSKILDKYLGMEIDVIGEEADLFTGRLVSFDGSSVVLDQGRGAGPVVTLNREKVSYIRFPSLPAGLISRPSLVWKIGADEAGERLVEVTYVTSSIDWHAEYVGVISEADDRIDLAAWVSIDNRSGTSYEEAQLDLVAGDVHRVRARGPDGLRAMDAEALVTGAKAAPEFAEEALFEYYLYKLDTPATVADREIKQLTFFPSTMVAVEKVFEFDYHRGSDVRVLLEFTNSEGAGLGRALPAGKVRMYKEDSADDLQFIGEDMIDHTPKDEDVELYLGNAFDVKVERTRTDQRKITDRVREEDYEVSVRNHKETSVTVRLVEHPRGYWEVTDTTHEFEKVESNRIEFEIPVEPDGETVVSYTIRYES